MNKYSGIITLLQVLDTEDQLDYYLIIKASSDVNYTTPLVIQSQDLDGGLAEFDPITDTSLLEVVITVTDDNDNPPVFTNNLYTGGK